MSVVLGDKTAEVVCDRKTLRDCYLLDLFVRDSRFEFNLENVGQPELELFSKLLNGQELDSKPDVDTLVSLGEMACYLGNTKLISEILSKLYKHPGTDYHHLFRFMLHDESAHILMRQMLVRPRYRRQLCDKLSFREHLSGQFFAIAHSSKRDVLKLIRGTRSEGCIVRFSGVRDS